jgi:threonine synthase
MHVRLERKGWRQAVCVKETSVQLRCSEPECGAAADASHPAGCARCGSVLEVESSLPQTEPEELKRRWRARRLSEAPIDASGVWRYRELLPEPLWAGGDVVTLLEGNTPLLAAQAGARHAGLRSLRIKHLGWNPTGSFKDAGMTVAITQARQAGARLVACASTGNTAASMAAYAARGGLVARVHLPAGGVTASKLAQATDAGAEIVQVDGSFDAVLDTLLRTDDPSIHVLNSVNPFRIEGQKTAVVSLLEQLDWHCPDVLVLPGGNLGNASAFGKALEEMMALHLITRVPRLVVVQAEGANAFVRTWRAGGGRLEVVAEPRTAASAIRIGAPRSWKRGLRALAFTGGLSLDVSEVEIAAAKRAIGRDGIGCEPASAVTVAGIRRLVADGTIGAGDDVVAVLTGHVLKDPEACAPSPLPADPAEAGAATPASAGGTR